MGTRSGEQETLFIAYPQVRGPGHPFYRALNRLLEKHGFDAYVEERCRKFYAEKVGRPGLAPGVYFRCLLLGYFEGLDSERGIAWRVADSLSLRDFLGLAADRGTPDHSTLSKTRKRIDVETHGEVFGWVLGVLLEAGLVKGKHLGVDATTLEANAAMRSIVRRDDGRTYPEYLRELAKASGVKTPTREDLARLDRKRRGRRTSNDDWQNPHDPGAQVTKMKDGRTHLAYQQEHAVDLETGAVVAVTVTGGAVGDTTSVQETVATAAEVLSEVDAQAAKRGGKRVADGIAALVADKGYHSTEVLGTMTTAMIRTYIAEPARGRRCWRGDRLGQAAVYGNRRRIQGRRGRRLLRQRAELVERSFAHTLDTGGLRRVHLRGQENILKRMLVQVAGFNLGLVMRAMFGFGKPRCIQGRLAAALAALCAYLRLLCALLPRALPAGSLRWSRLAPRGRPRHELTACWGRPVCLASATGC